MIAHNTRFSNIFSILYLFPQVIQVISSVSLVSFPCSHKKKWKKSNIFSLVYLLMNQMPWSIPALLISALILKNIPAATESESGCSSFAEHLVERTSCTAVKRQAGVTCTEPRGTGEEGVRLHTCVNDTKQSRFISGRKTNQLEPDNISQSISSFLASHRICVPYSHRITSSHSHVFSENTLEIRHSYTFTYIRRCLLENAFFKQNMYWGYNF